MHNFFLHKNILIFRRFFNSANRYIGICSQAPVKGECVSEFSELSLSTDNVGDFRLGN